MSKKTDKIKKLTLTDLIAKKEQRDKAKLAFKDIHVESLGGTIVAQRPSDEVILETIDLMGNNDSAKEIVAAFKYLIYTSIPILKEPSLQEAYECVEPDEIVMKLFDIGEVLEVGAAILEMAGVKDIGETLKN
ncbi:hypothetical protein HNQ80_001045 [Anaerosolibacter carboniphilus]|uniref:Phage XkdN-like tail assembly chaperone protein, TAC n=1 Tax=Anaerosolibacter carboniphilus TaxID=1417629 RepID=A0A841KSD9_9FIRM|nr:hypothetical protein [Anaerosolibacter carboniphilus]MBB6214960.1 hypothetical protein [Anaerosolibacter carboniphilus]